MKKRYEVNKLDYNAVARLGCLKCQKAINKGRLTVYADWIIYNLVEGTWDGACIKHFGDWISEMENGEHGIFDKYQTIHISRIMKSLIDLQPEEYHKAKNIESLK